MASAIIHLAIAKELEKEFSIKNKKDYFLGSIAADISKEINQDRNISHFITTKDEIPNINLFTNKYPNFKSNSFELGYFIHLYTDKLWRTFIKDKITPNSIKLTDGTIYKTTFEEVSKMIYSDYTNLNIKVIENHFLDLSLFYEEFQIPFTSFNEIPINKLNILIDKMGIIIENSKENKPYCFDIDSIEEFISSSTITIKNILSKY